MIPAFTGQTTGAKIGVVLLVAALTHNLQLASGGQTWGEFFCGNIKSMLILLTAIIFYFLGRYAGREQEVVTQPRNERKPNKKPPACSDGGFLYAK